MIETSFGPIRVADAHVHFFGRGFLETLARQMTPPAREVDALARDRLGWEPPPADPEGLARRWVEEMDRHGVDRIVSIASVPGDEGSPAAAARAYPDRIAGYFMLDPTAEGAVDRARRGFGESGLRGVCLFPAMHRFRMEDPAVAEVCRAASDFRAAVFVHCGKLKVGVREKLGLPCAFDLALANPLDLVGPAQAFPEVPFVVPHFGCGLFGEMLEAARRCPNLHVDTSSSNSWIDEDPDLPDLETVFRRTLDVIGPGRILFGTDSSFFPRGWRRDVFEAQVAVLERIDLSRGEATSILGGNLFRVLGLHSTS